MSCTAINRLVLYVDNNNPVIVDRLQNGDGVYVDGDDVTLTLTLYDSDDAAVTNATAITFDYISGSNGRFRGIIPENAAIVDGGEYTLIIDDDAGDFHIEIECQAVTRTL